MTVSERRNHLGGSLVGLAGACWVGALVADGSKAMEWLSAPSLVLFVAGALSAVAAVFAFRGRPAARRRTISPAASPGDLVLALAPELEEAADRVGTAAERGEWWAPSETPPSAMWAAREEELRTLGRHFHKPVSDAYRKVAAHIRQAKRAEAIEYQAVGRVVDRPGRELSDEDRAALRDTHGVIAHALERLTELEPRLGTVGEHTSDESATRVGAEKPVSREHRDELRLVAITILEAIHYRGPLRYLPPDEPRPNLARSFREHFADLARQLDLWAELIARRETDRSDLHAWVSARVQELDYQAYPYSGEIASLIANEAQQPEPQLTFGMVAGHLHSGGYHVYTPTDVANLARPSIFDREGIERDLRQFLAEAVARPERARIMEGISELEQAQQTLSAELELIRDKHSIPTGHGCALCR
jgi:hypothetical protein